MLKTIIVIVIFLAAAAAALMLLKKNGAGKRQLLSVGLLLVSMCAAYIVKDSIETPYVNEYVPFYKVINLIEYGYASVLSDLLHYAVPFVAAGFFMLPAFAGMNLLSTFVAGVLMALVFSAARLIGGGSFVTDEYLFAGIGCASGFGIYCVLIDLLKKKPFVEKNDIPVPGKMKGLAGTLFAIAVYLFIALVMVFDYGETYAPIQFFESDVPLPAMTLETELETEEANVYVYAPSTQSAQERATAVSLGLSIGGGAQSIDGMYVAEDANAKLVYTESGSWTYELKAASGGAEPTQADAERAVRKLFGERTLLTVALGEATDVVRKTDSDGNFTQYDFYFDTAVGECPIIGSNTLVVSVAGDEAVTMIRKYDGDLMSESSQRIISQSSAYDKLISGEGAYTLFSAADSARVTKCRLAYMANSSQGYYLPIWLFDCEATLASGETATFEAYVEAMK